MLRGVYIKGSHCCADTCVGKNAYLCLHMHSCVLSNTRSLYQIELITLVFDLCFINAPGKHSS